MLKGLRRSGELQESAEARVKKPLRRAPEFLKRQWQSMSHGTSVARSAKA